MEEFISNLPQVFIDTDIPVVQDELRCLAGLSTRFRTASKVCLPSALTTHLTSRMG
jgi:hypothetical protein